jgi:hypothetical protein
MKHKRQIEYAENRIKQIGEIIKNESLQSERLLYLQNERINHRTFIDICKHEETIADHKEQADKLKKLVTTLYKTQPKKKCGFIYNIIRLFK